MAVVLWLLFWLLQFGLPWRVLGQQYPGLGRRFLEHKLCADEECSSEVIVCSSFMVAFSLASQGLQNSVLPSPFQAIFFSPAPCSVKSRCVCLITLSNLSPQLKEILFVFLLLGCGLETLPGISRSFQSSHLTGFSSCTEYLKMFFSCFTPFQNCLIWPLLSCLGWKLFHQSQQTCFFMLTLL